MKRSVNLARTRNISNPFLEVGLFLQDIGMTDDSIASILRRMDQEAARKREDRRERAKEMREN